MSKVKVKTVVKAKPIQIPPSLYEQSHLTGNNSTVGELVEKLSIDLGKIRHKDLVALAFASTNNVNRAIEMMYKENNNPVKGDLVETASMVLSGIAFLYIIGDIKWMVPEEGEGGAVIANFVPEEDYDLDNTIVELRSGKKVDATHLLHTLNSVFGLDEVKNPISKTYKKPLLGIGGLKKDSVSSFSITLAMLLVASEIEDEIE